MTRIVKCPHCGKEVEWSPKNKFRPFCCERCKQIDLGRWAAEENVIKTPITPETLENENTMHEIAQALENAEEEKN